MCKISSEAWYLQKLLSMQIEQVTRDIHPELFKTATPPSDEFYSLETIMESRLEQQQLEVKALSDNTEGVNTDGKSGFFEAIFYAYHNHLALRLSPDDVWVAIMQAVSLHITNKSEELRDRFVNFKDQKTLTVVVNPWTGSSANWQQGFQGFSTLINENLIPEAQGLVKPKFSTTTPVSSAVCDVVIMDCFKNYFKYSLRGGCGIPKVTLTGTVDDWVLLKTQAEKLIAYADLAWWIPYIVPILEEFVNFMKGVTNVKFWDCIIKPCPAAGSGNYFWKEGYHERMSGWFANFFPHTVTPVMGFASNVEQQKQIEAKNRYMLTLAELYAIHDQFEAKIKTAESKVLSEYMIKLKHGFEMKYLPSNISVVGVDFQNMVTGEKYRAVLQAGFFGYKYSEENKEISPCMGWCVASNLE